MPSLKQLKQLNGSNKFLVFGYIRKTEKESRIMNIPMLIFYNILGYFHLFEYFSKCGDEIIISDDKMTITKKEMSCDDWNNNSYGNLWFASNGNEIATWKFRINKIQHSTCNSIYFIFSSKDNRLNDDGNHIEDSPNYGWSNYDDAIFHGGGALHYDCWKKDDDKHEEGDVISITLNTKNGVIAWSPKRDEQMRTVYTGIKQNPAIRYKLAISLCYQQNSVSLIDFKCLNA